MLDFKDIEQERWPLDVINAEKPSNAAQTYVDTGAVTVGKNLWAFTHSSSLK